LLGLQGLHPFFVTLVTQLFLVGLRWKAAPEPRVTLATFVTHFL
jgi:hypothetical protein